MRHGIRLLTAVALKHAANQPLLWLSIWMYWNEGAHARPHFDARYAGHAASVDFDGELIAGSLPRRALALVAEWTALHQDELRELGAGSARGAARAGRSAALT